MKTINFAWTTPALLAGAKTCTRRDWDDDYARRFRKGEMVAAYDRQARYKGQQIATIRLIATPTKESTGSAPQEDYEAEGFIWLMQRGFKVAGLTPRALWFVWHSQPRDMWVVRFELVTTGPNSPDPRLMRPPVPLASPAGARLL